MSWLTRTQSITYIFKSELENLLTPFDDNFNVTNGTYPHLYRKYRQGFFSPETIIILDDILGFFKYWNKKIDDDIVWPKDYLKLTKYKHFLSFERKKFKIILSDLYK